MTSRVIWTLSALAIAASVQLPAQTNRELSWTAQTPWGDPELQGEWTTEGEYGVPFERSPQFGTRQFLTDAEYAVHRPGNLDGVVDRGARHEKAP